MTPENHIGGWRSLSGVRLEGTKLTRAVFLDESGLSRDEPYLVVAGIIIHADSQMGPVEDALQEIIDANIDEPHRDGFVLHASALFSGNKTELPPEIWDEAARVRILRQIFAIPGKLKLPVCIGSVDKKRFPWRGAPASATKHQIKVAMHAAAIAECVMNVEQWMRGNTDEVAFLFAENNDEVRNAAKETQILMKSKDAAEVLDVLDKKYLPLVRIKDGINFATKEESKALQLADACAWAYRKSLLRDIRALHFYAALQPQIFSVSMTTFDAAARL
jgi:hypothetical protein